MSTEAWKHKYYPIVASKATATPMEATKHSVLKWTGLAPEILEAHGMRPLTTLNPRTQFQCISDEGGYGFWIDSNSCALCTRAEDLLGKTDPYRVGLDTMCTHCPLADVREGVSCTKRMADEEVSPYDEWTQNGNHALMLTWLHRTEAFLIGQETEKAKKAKKTKKTKKAKPEKRLDTHFSCPHCCGDIRIEVSVAENVEVLLSATVQGAETSTPCKEPNFATHTDAGKLRLALWRAGLDEDDAKNVYIRNDKLPGGGRELKSLVYSRPVPDAMWDNIKEHIVDIFGKVRIRSISVIGLALRVYLYS